MSNTIDFSTDLSLTGALPQATYNTDASILGSVFALEGVIDIAIYLSIISRVAGSIGVKSVSYADDVGITTGVTTFDSATTNEFVFRKNDESDRVNTALQQTVIQTVKTTKISFQNRAKGLQKFCRVTFETTNSANLVAKAEAVLLNSGTIVQI